MTLDEPRIAIFGGTFNPPHAGHRACLEIALKEFGERLEGILVVPANGLYYKEQATATPEERLEMCRLAFGDLPKVQVSDVDIARGGITYTVDTLADVRKAFPGKGKPVFILGADSFATLPSWKESARLKEEATFLIIPRGEALDVDTGDWDAWVAEAVAPSLSSTGIRGRLVCGESAVGDVAPEVLCYIRERNLYGSMADMSGTEDVFSEAFQEARKVELLSRVGERRYAHSIGVAETARSLAETYGADPAKAYLAGLLHDWDKCFDDAGIRTRADELGLDIREDVYWGAPQTLHGITAAAALGKEFPGIPVDVLQAISRHTTGAPDMSDLDMIVFIADALEPGRNFEGLAELRAMVGTVELEELFLSVEAHWIGLIVRRKKTLHPDTFAVWNTYAARHRDRKHSEGFEIDPGSLGKQPN